MKLIVAALLIAYAPFATSASECSRKGKGAAAEDVALCLEVGRALRCRPSDKEAILEKAERLGWVNRLDYGYITSKRPRIGMTLCSVIAAFGKPEHSNRSVNAYGTQYQLIYGRRYIYVDDDKVTGWQD